MNNESAAATVKTIAAALAMLPEDKRNFLVGYAEGVIAMGAEQTLAAVPQPSLPSAPN